MKRFYSFAIILFTLFSIAPCAAKPKVLAFHEYLRENNIPIYGVNSSGVNAGINFKPEATQEQKDFANAARASFNWVDTPDPDYRSFRLACYKLAQVGSVHIPYINAISDPTLPDADRKALWTKAKGLLGGLDPATARIENAATTYGVALK